MAEDGRVRGHAAGLLHSSGKPPPCPGEETVPEIATPVLILPLNSCFFGVQGPC